MKRVAFFAVVLLVLAGCTDADVASRELSQDAEYFRVFRQVDFYDGINGEVFMSVDGYCSIEDQGTQLEVTCRTDDGYQKHFLGLSDNVTYVVRQIDSRPTSARPTWRINSNAIVPMVTIE